MKVLFVLKYREVSDDLLGVYSYSGMSSGLMNSARMVKEMLNLNGHESKLVQVVDNNCIDREVTLFKPDVVIIEAFWVVPEKFQLLNKLHPSVKWIIRNHSNIPFLAQEGMIMNWATKCVRVPNVFLATNTKQSLNDLKVAVAEKYNSTPPIAAAKVIYFPNYYVQEVERCWRYKSDSTLDVGCFGAIRPLKNHLVQAIAAIDYAQQAGKKLKFHVNSGRQESGGMPVLHNLRGLFDGNRHSQLVEHTWKPHAEFVKVIASMDVSTQVSFTETFNIVTADAVTMGVPVVVSPDVFWIHNRYHADPTSSTDVVEKIDLAIDDSLHGKHSRENMHGLHEYNTESMKAIIRALKFVMGDR